MAELNLSALSEREFVTRKELAAIFAVGESTIKKWEEREGLPTARVGHQRLYETAAVREWLRRKAA